MAVLLTCRNEVDPVKNGVLTRLYIDFSHAQEQLTLKYVMESRRNSNSIKLRWLSSLSARMKKIQLKVKALDCLRHISHNKYGIFKFRRSRAANSAVFCRIEPKFELVRDIMVVLLTYKNEEDPIKNEVARLLTQFPPL